MPKPQLAPNVKKNRISSLLTNRYVPTASVTTAQKRDIKSILDTFAERKTPEQIAGSTIQQVFASRPDLVPIVTRDLENPSQLMFDLSNELKPYRNKDVQQILSRYQDESGEANNIPSSTIISLADYLNNATNPNKDELARSLGGGVIPFINAIGDYGRGVVYPRLFDELKSLPTKESTRVSEEETAAMQAREARVRERALVTEREAAQRREAERLSQLTAANQAANPIDTSTPQGQEAARRQESTIRQNVSIEDALRQQYEAAQANENKRRTDERLARETNAAIASTKKAKKPTAAEAIQDLESKISAGETTSTQNLPAYHQEALKGLYKGAVRDVFNREYEPYLNERIAQKTPLQALAQQRLVELDPFLGETKANQQNIIDRIRGLDKDPAKTAIREYLNPASQTLGQAHEDLIGAEERAAEDVYRRRGMEHLQEDVLPKIRNKYSPISHIHGGRDKELTRAVRNYGREIEDSLAGMRLKNRAITVPAALQHRDQQTRSGQALANASISDAQHSMAAIEGLQKAQDATIGSKEKFINSMHGIGQAEQAREQQKNDLAYEQFKEQRDQGLNNLQRFSDLIRGHPQPVASTSTNLLPPRIMRSNASSAGELMSAQAGRMMPQAAFKKGGRVTKADGGNISPLQDAINWSVIDRESPIDEMKRNARRQQAMDMMGRLKNHRQMYAEGGAISPIEKGAMTASNIAMLEKSKQDRERFREYNASKQVHQPNPWLTDFFKTGSKAVAQSKALAPYGGVIIPNGFDNALSAMSVSFDEKDKERAAFEKAQQEAMDRDLGLLKDEEGIERDSRKFDFETEKFKEQMDLNRLMHQENVRHHQAVESSKGSLNPEKKDALKKELKEQLDKAIYQYKTAQNLHDIAGDVPTGRAAGQISGVPLVGHLGASLLSLVEGKPTSPFAFQALDDASEDYFNARVPTKGRITDQQEASRRKAKAGNNKSQEFNLKQTSEEMAKAQSDINLLLSQYAKYADPHEIMDYKSYYKPSSGGASATPATQATPSAGQSRESRIAELRAKRGY